MNLFLFILATVASLSSQQSVHDTVKSKKCTNG